MADKENIKEKSTDKENTDGEMEKDTGDNKSPDDGSGLKKELEKARQEAKEEHERFLRLYAEFENYKKRSAREVSDFKKFANENLIKELLPVLDNMERALESSEEGDDAKESIIKGVKMTYEGILKILEKANVKPVESMGKPFDPAFHEAIGQEETDGDENMVVREFQKGYMLHDRLIRPAMVIVSKKKDKDAGKENQDNEDFGNQADGEVKIEIN